MCCDPISAVDMNVAMFPLLVFMLISASSMFDLHVLVAVYVMFNILKLIMEIVSNSSIAAISCM